MVVKFKPGDQIQVIRQLGSLIQVGEVYTLDDKYYFTSALGIPCYAGEDSTLIHYFKLYKPIERSIPWL